MEEKNKREGRGRPRKPGMIKIELRVSKAEHDRVKQFCKKYGLPKSKFIMLAAISLIEDKLRCNQILVDHFLCKEEAQKN